MSQVAIAEFPNAQVPTPVRRMPSMTLRNAGRKARLSGVASNDPMMALMAELPKALGRRMRFHRPHDAEQTFDEMWLANAFDAIKTGDEPRYRFAMLSRMSKESASRLHFLMCRAACALDKT